jgi:hypothetical protein
MNYFLLPDLHLHLSGRAMSILIAVTPLISILRLVLSLAGNLPYKLHVHLRASSRFVISLVLVVLILTTFPQELQGYPPAQHGASWRFGNGGIGFNRLMLSALWNVYDDVWLAEVIVDFR